MLYKTKLLFIFKNKFPIMENPLITSPIHITTLNNPYKQSFKLNTIHYLY